MDVSALNISLHPIAKELLFKHYQPLRRIFSDVLGQLETDYVSIALVNSSNQLFLFSSSPAADLNILEKELWVFDQSLQAAFIFQDAPRTWDSLYDAKHHERLYQYKLGNLGLVSGIALPTNFGRYRAVFSYGFKKHNPRLKEYLQQVPNPLMAMGQFCLREITSTITLPDEKAKVMPLKPKLKLVINNEVNYESITR